jgi:hypothetical protein
MFALLGDRKVKRSPRPELAWRAQLVADRLPPQDTCDHGTEQKIAPQSAQRVKAAQEQTPGVAQAPNHSDHPGGVAPVGLYGHRKEPSDTSDVRYTAELGHHLVAHFVLLHFGMDHANRTTRLPIQRYWEADPICRQDNLPNEYHRNRWRPSTR